MSAPQLEAATVACSLPRMARDFRRVLRVQWKEFVHFLDENMLEKPANVRPVRNHRICADLKAIMRSVA